MDTKITTETSARQSADQVLEQKIAAETKAREEAVEAVLSDLTGYYLKNETYSRSEVQALISAIPKFAIEVVSALPTSNISGTTVYLLKTGDESSNIYTEYIYTNGKWESLGTQKVDLSGYLPLTGGQLSNNLTIYRSGATSVDFIAQNGLRQMSFGLSTAGDGGIYDFKHDKWTIVSKTDGTVHTSTPTDLNAHDTQIATTDWVRKTSSKKYTLTGTIQYEDYLYSVIALCETCPNYTEKNSYSTGRLYFKRTNGLYPMGALDISVESSYTGEHKINFSMLGYNNFENLSVLPCTFTYGGVRYGGIAIQVNGSMPSLVEFVRDGGNFDTFALNYYNHGTKTVLNNEVYNSINFDNAVYKYGIPKFNNSKILTAADVTIENGVTIINLG